MTKRSKKNVKSEDTHSGKKEEDNTLLPSFHTFTNDEVIQFREKLLHWYDKEKRDLPWRQITTSNINERAYAIWVSEIMLQQTQVATVIDYYNKWMSKWPTLKDLASSNIEKVNEAWSGLGYYSRGRRLFEGAQKVVNELKSEMPKTAAALQKELPGVGRYTAGAVASIAFGQVTPIVDGNVIRVLTRMRMIGGNTTQPDIIENIWQLASALVDPDRPGDLNQGLMELGATVCTPKSPACQRCPVENLCKARAKVNRTMKSNALKVSLTTKLEIKEEEKENNIVDIECLVPDCKQCLPSDDPWKNELGVMNYPRKPKKAKAKEEVYNVVVLSSSSLSDNAQRFLVSKRPKTGLLAGLWEFPNQINDEGKKDVLPFIEKVIDTERKCLSDLKEVGEVNHQFSHVHHSYKVWSVILTATHLNKFSRLKEIQGEDERETAWLTAEEIAEAAVSTGMKKVFELFKGCKDSKKSLKRKRSKDSNVNGEGSQSQRSISDFFKKK